ncbi:restriction endonuclease subunit S [Ligilactobacillus salivarius]|uniref:Type I restriction modification DNA specificity domain-containing protein n=1 Tax=Ligilactobacillus salivarius TaxID=1624 RepID=A0A1Y0FAQ0_9LACO|nr:restriction endonuclease subunit S [Ligilactobacillus salivarius]ARU20263.1 hypothetical protein B7R82_09810 [Ligilactobacillus salivarius]
MTKYKLGEIIELNPRESIKKGNITRKIAMDDLGEFKRDIESYSYSEYKGGTKFRNYDTLMARITPCLENGKTSFVNILEENEVAFGSTEYFVFRAKQDIINPYYLYYLVTTDKFREVAIKSMSGTSGRQRVQKDQILDFSVDLPSLEDQEKIMKPLKLIDDKISLNTKLNTNLFELANIIFQQSFNCNGNIPLSHYFLPKRGKNLLKKNVEPGAVPVVAGGLKPAAYHNISNTETPVITISASGANAGYVQIWGQKVWSSDSSYIDSSITDNIYFWYIFLKSRQKQIFDAQTGSAQPHIYPKHIGNLLISELDEEQVQSFNKKVTPIFEKIFQNQKNNSVMEDVKNSLLYKFFNDY